MIDTIDPVTALVLIDLQNGIVAGDKAHPVAGVLEQANRLLDAFHQARLPVVLVRVDPTAGAWSHARADRSMGLPDDPQARAGIRQGMAAEGFFDFVETLHRDSRDRILGKHDWNAFFDTSLHQFLLTHQVTQVVLAGISTSIGVEGTARAAAERGYHLSFPVDAMTDASAQAHQHSVERIFPRIGQVGSSSDVVELLAQRPAGE